jgi:hypothetical protein
LDTLDNIEFFSTSDIREIQDYGFKLGNTPKQLHPASKKGDRIDIHIKNIEVFIFKLKDEWFLVRCQMVISNGSNNHYSNKYYKCDQLDGLFECLDKIKLKS